MDKFSMARRGNRTGVDHDGLQAFLFLNFVVTLRVNSYKEKARSCFVRAEQFFTLIKVPQMKKCLLPYKSSVAAQVCRD